MCFGFSGLKAARQELLDSTAKSNGIELDLRLLIKKQIIPHRYQTDTKPPFTETELTAMALVCEGKPLTAPATMSWINKEFEYYGQQAQLAFRELTDQREQREAGSDLVSPFKYVSKYDPKNWQTVPTHGVAVLTEIQATLEAL
jgi:hypothetical protein